MNVKGANEPLLHNWSGWWSLPDSTFLSGASCETPSSPSSPLAVSPSATSPGMLTCSNRALTPCLSPPPHPPPTPPPTPFHLPPLPSLSPPYPTQSLFSSQLPFYWWWGTWFQDSELLAVCVHIFDVKIWRLRYVFGFAATRFLPATA